MTSASKLRPGRASGCVRVRHASYYFFTQSEGSASSRSTRTDDPRSEPDASIRGCPIIPKMHDGMPACRKCIPKYFVNFSQISGQDPITFLRISASCAVVLRITQTYADTKLRIMVTAIGGSGSAAMVRAALLRSRNFSCNIQRTFGCNCM